jgi:hypothetical protein
MAPKSRDEPPASSNNDEAEPQETGPGLFDRYIEFDPAEVAGLARATKPGVPPPMAIPSEGPPRNIDSLVDELRVDELPAPPGVPADALELAEVQLGLAAYRELRDLHADVVGVDAELEPHEYARAILGKVRQMGERIAEMTIAKGRGGR